MLTSRVDIERKLHEKSWYYKAEQSASTNEKSAGKIIENIREVERKGHFGNVPSESIPSPESEAMGGKFLRVLDRIESSKLFNIAEHCPKGAHLHLHFNTEINVKLLFQWARRLSDTMFVSVSRFLLSTKDYDNVEIVFSVLEKEQQTVDFFSGGSEAETSKKRWMRWAEFRSRFPPDIEVTSMESLDRAEAWACGKIVMTKEKVYREDQTHNGAWAYFNQGTRAVKGLTNYETALKRYVGVLIDRCVNDKVMHVELRLTMLDKSIPTDDGKGRLDHEAQMRIILDEDEKKRKELKHKGKSDMFPFGIKIIYCAPRSLTLERMEEELINCLRLKRLFPTLIIGFDLVGAEDRANSISFYDEVLRAFVFQCEQAGVSIPFLFHAGETLLDTGGSSDPGQSNLIDAFIRRSKRVGHGYALTKQPWLIEQYKVAGIALELCPTSNEILHLCGTIGGHPYWTLLQNGLHCTLNADNPSLFRGLENRKDTTLSHEFYQVMVGEPRMSIHCWKQLAEWSLEHSCLTPEEQEKAFKIFVQDWEEFCVWVGDTYPEHAATTSARAKQL